MQSKLPNFELEWGEATRYPEFVQLGKSGWISLVSKGKKMRITSAHDINNTDAITPNAFQTLDINKVSRVLQQFVIGSVEMPIVAFYDDGFKELIGGNTRLTGMLETFGYADIWVFHVSEEVSSIVK